MDMRPLCMGMSSEWAHVHECNMIEVFSMYTFMYNVQCKILASTCTCLVFVACDGFLRNYVIVHCIQYLCISWRR